MEYILWDRFRIHSFHDWKWQDRGETGVVIVVANFKTSAPGKVIYDKLDLIAQNVVDKTVYLPYEEKRAAVIAEQDKRRKQ